MTPQVRLSQMIAKGTIPHALLFAGPKGSGKKEAAYQFAHTLIGKESSSELPSHPDIHLFFPEGKLGLHTIGHLREVIADVALVPFQAEWKIFIIHEAERMLASSSNALLKTFEEPTSRTVIILLSNHPEKILSTVLSRCQKIDFFSTLPRSKSPILDILAKKNSLSTLEEESLNVEELLETIVLWYRDRLLMEIEGGDAFFSFPEYLPQIQDSSLIPLDQLDRFIGQTRLAVERSMKLSFALEILFLQIKKSSY